MHWPAEAETQLQLYLKNRDTRFGTLTVEITMLQCYREIVRSLDCLDSTWKALLFDIQQASGIVNQKIASRWSNDHRSLYFTNQAYRLGACSPVSPTSQQ